MRWRLIRFALILVLTCVGAIAGADGDTAPLATRGVQVFLDGTPVAFDTPPQMIGGRLLVPVRQILERLGMHLEWEPGRRTLTAARGEQMVMLTVDSRFAMANWQPVVLDVPARITAGRLLVPLRFLVEATGGEVDWDPITGRVVLEVADEDRKVALRVAKLNRELPPLEHRYTARARQVGFVLETPDRAQVVVDGTLHLSGRVGGGYEQDAVLARWRKGGEEREAAFPVREGRFAGTIHLAEGTGEYKIVVWLPVQPKDSHITSVAELTVRNENPRPRFGPYWGLESLHARLQAELPNDGNLAVDGALPLTGTAPVEMDGRFVWAKAEKEGQTWDTFIPLQGGRYQGPVYLGGGAGLHWVTLWLQQANGATQFTRMAQIPVVNTSASVSERHEYLLPGVTAELRLTDPALPAETQEGVVRVAGKLHARYEGTRVWLRAEWAGRRSDVFLTVKEGGFAGSLPLTAGLGVYRVTVLVPKLDEPDYYHEAAHFKVRSLTTRRIRGIRYTSEGLDRDLLIEQPAAGVIGADQQLRVSGTVDQGKLSSKFPFLYAEVKRGALDATYRLPVRQGWFDGDVWLRFGPGDYVVTLFAPLNSKEAIAVASFDATNHGAADLRYLAPSNGVEADDPEVKALAATLTAGKGDDLARARAIFDWVSREVRYDYLKAAEWRMDPDEGAIRTLRTRTGVCRDYTYLAVALARAAGLESRIVVGKAGQPNSPFGVTDHSWVEVRVGDRWLEMDPTFASGVVIGTRFIPRFNPDYFDPKPEFMAEDHTREGIVY